MTHPRTDLSRRLRRRPWTRLAAIGAGAHVFYELAAGVAMPFASRTGPLPMAMVFGGSTAWVLDRAGRRPDGDTMFSLIDGVYLSAVLGHFATWPRTSVAGVPWLVECEGLTGRLMPPYNLILHVSGVAAVAGLVENRRGGWWGVLVPLALTPALVFETPREYARLRTQARRRPRWWNRRLQPRQAASPGLHDLEPGASSPPRGAERVVPPSG
jgi:hypothetical protein